MNRYPFLWLSASAVMTLLWTAVGAAQPASFRGVGTELRDPLLGISAMADDGSVLVGGYQPPPATGDPEAFRWTEAEGIVGLGFLGEGAFQSGAEDVSSDGSVIVGASLWPDARGWEAFRWTEADGMVALGGGRDSCYAGCVSADGSVIIGSYKQDNVPYVGRWTEAAGWEPLPQVDLAVHDISTDASVIAGDIGRGFLMWEAGRWTEETGTVPLGYLFGPPERAYEGTNVRACSGDGSVVIGYSHKRDVTVDPFRWSEETGMVNLDPGSVLRADVYDVSYDGSIIVGYVMTDYAPTGATAAIWDTTHGWRR